jgi:cold shock CspA family protein
MRTSGALHRFDDAKGFGFITRADDPKDCFVYDAAVEGSGYGPSMRESSLNSNSRNTDARR